MDFPSILLRWESVYPFFTALFSKPQSARIDSILFDIMGVVVRIFPAFIVISLLFPVFVAQHAQADAWPPTLTIIDEAGVEHTAPDNSTEFTIIPGGRCTFKVEGPAGWLFSLPLF